MKTVTQKLKKLQSSLPQNKKIKLVVVTKTRTSKEIEEAISAAAKDQLFEFNDEITRTNFVNIVEPFLRDVQSKRGIFDFRVVCDETNNTAAIIDNNEFIADIFIKPARSINFIGLTFVATRTGISFDEVIGTV